jgi:hypothetical protein
MLRVFLAAVLIAAGVVALGVALTVDCGSTGVMPAWLDVTVGAIQFGGRRSSSPGS